MRNTCVVDAIKPVFLNRGLTEPLVFHGAVSGVRWKSFNILTRSGYQGAAGHLFSGENWTSEDVMTFFFGLHLILGGNLDVGRRDVPFFFLLKSVFSPDFRRKIGRRETW